MKKILFIIIELLIFQIIYSNDNNNYELIKNIIQSSLKKELYYNNKVKLGITKKELITYIGDPIEVENLEWGCYYFYDKYSIGLDGYKHEINDNTKIITFVYGFEDLLFTEIIKILNTDEQKFDIGLDYYNKIVIIYNIENICFVFYSKDTLSEEEFNELSRNIDKLKLKELIKDSFFNIVKIYIKN